MIRVPSDELEFGWSHRKGQPSTCVIKHNGRVVKRGNYRDMIELFNHITDTEETVAIQYEDEARPTVPEAPSASAGGDAP